MKAQRKRSLAPLLDALTIDVDAALIALKAEDARLTEAGCIKAYAHFKTGTRKMYLNEPCDPKNGKRRFTYVGVDPTAQADALAKIARYEAREQLRENAARLKYELADIIDRLVDVVDDLKSLKRDAGDVVTEAMKGHRPARPLRPRRYPSARMGSPIARAGAGQA